MTLRRAIAATLCLLLASCAAPLRLSRSGEPLGEAAYDRPPEPHEVPANIAEIPDAVVREEPPSASGNAPQYQALGQTYTVLKSANGYKQKGLASWYGKHFQGKKTASGERFDMYAMSAAHRTLPLPSFARVTNVKNGKSVVVRINDRGPFIKGRIIDLSYAAAARLDILSHGEAQVEVEAVVPSTNPGWLQVAIYADAINAVAMREDLERRGLGAVEIWPEEGNPPMHRVVIGPFDNVDASAKARETLLAQGMPTEWIQRKVPGAISVRGAE